MPALFCDHKRMKQLVGLALVIAALTACSKAPESARAPVKDERSPDSYRVTLDTSKGPAVIQVHRDWAPIGSDRFYTLVKQGYFDQARFFRVIPGFMAQFGLAADPKVTAKWEGTELDDDAVRQSNGRGLVSFATRGLRSRTTQLFINTGNNAGLDEKGFAPFGRVESGMDTVEEFYSGYGETPEQGAITQQGNSYLEQAFPRLDYIKTARIAP